MADVHDVAAYILKKHGAMSAMKLQKLVYYCQAWHVAWGGRRLFRARIEAWANGPIVPVLYCAHRGKFRVKSWSKGRRSRLNESERESVDSVLEYYGDKSPQWLASVVHREDPWVLSRRGLHMGEPGNEVIPVEAMESYYSSL